MAAARGHRLVLSQMHSGKQFSAVHWALKNFNANASRKKYKENTQNTKLESTLPVVTLFRAVYSCICCEVIITGKSVYVKQLRLAVAVAYTAGTCQVWKVRSLRRDKMQYKTLSTTTRTLLTG